MCSSIALPLTLPPPPPPGLPLDPTVPHCAGLDCALSPLPPHSKRHAAILHVEYVERGKYYGILFIFSLFCEYRFLEYVLFMSYTGLTRWNTLFVLLWLHHRNT